MRERDIEAYLVKSVKALGGEVRKVRWLGRRGAPDRLVMLPAYRPAPLPPRKFCDTGQTGFYPDTRLRPAATIWVELKAPGKKAEPHQLREHKRMEKMGQRVVVIDSLEGVEELLAGAFR